jgi:chemotaxis protein MotB
MTSKPRYYRPETTQRWMVSYVDVLTILLIFFVALSAQSLHSRPLPKPAPPHSDRPTPFDPPAKAEPRGLLLEAQRELARRGMHPKLEPRGLVISLPQEILFPSGQDRPGPEGLATLAQLAEVLQGIPNSVSVVGHSDALPIHSPRYRSNWELSAARSLKLLELLMQKYGIAESRLSMAGFGSTRPRGANDTGDGRAANRRVEIVILDEAAQ